jgi:hypothetical protein
MVVKAGLRTMAIRIRADGYSNPSAQDILRRAVSERRNRAAGWLPIEPFVTISRQPATGADSLPARLALRLNDGETARWSVWDHTLIKRVSAVADIGRRLERMIVDEAESWMQELADGYVIGLERCDAAEFAVYQRVTAAIRSLAGAGKVIIVGRGGMFVTHGMANGIRIRVVAPMGHRIRCMAEEFGLSTREAAERVAEADHDRDVFFHRYWPGRVVAQDAFTTTFNAAEMTIDDMVESVLSVLRARQDVRPREAYLKLA